MTDSEKLDLLLKGMQNINTKLSALEERTLVIESTLQDLGTRISALEKRMHATESTLQDLGTRLSAVEQDTKLIKLVIENELRVNIQRIAEGHLDLSRALHEASKPSNEIEMLTVRVNLLETDVQSLKRQLA